MAARNATPPRRSPARSAYANQFAPSNRLLAILVLFGFAALVIVGRLVWLSVIAAPANSEEAVQSRIIDIELPARRGTIYDRNGVILATDVEATTVYCNPYEVKDVEATAQAIAQALGGDVDGYKSKLTTEDTPFAYLYRKADTDKAQALKALNLEGVYFLSDTKRVYPNGQIAGQVVGMVDIDDKGQSGLELQYDDILSGTAGHYSAERGAADYPIVGGIHDEEPAVDGEDIILTIDLEMQEYLENRLAQAVTDIEGKNGTAVLYDASNGELVAVASVPFLNPGDREHVLEGATELRAVSYPFEPGSIFKTVTATAALEAGVLQPSTTIKCPAALPADEYYVTDAHERADTTYTFSDIIKYSSNVGMALVGEKLGFAPLYDKIEAYNLTSTTGVDYPGESSGYSTDPSTWTTIQAYNVTFGQGISVTPLQMVRFYGALENNGIECTPHLLRERPLSEEVLSYPTTQVIQNTDVIPQMTEMLKGVVADGTGTKAQIEGFEPAGKTGTAEYVGEDGTYVEGMYNISFVGYLPDSDSDLVCFVGVTEVPGDRITTPAFKDIMSFAIDRYKISAE